ncbi:MAG: amino acid adenylation domain-containing protein [Pseudomonadota bacterium]
MLDNPVTRERMATLLAKADGLAALVDHVAGALDEGREVPTEIYSILKLCLEFHWEAADTLVQLLGARGYDERNIAAQILRDARVGRIGEGPSETHAMFVGLRLLNDSSELPGYLRTVLADEGMAERVDKVVARLRESGVNPADPQDAAQALHLGQLAALALLMAALCQATQSDAIDPEQSATRLTHHLAEAEHALWQAQGQRVPGADHLDRRVKAFSAAIGDVEEKAAAIDPYLKRDPTAWAAERHLNAVPAALMPEDDTPSGTSRLVRDILVELTGLTPGQIGPSTQLYALGLDSLQATRLSARLSDLTDRPVELSTILEAATVAELIAALNASTPERTIALRTADRSGPLPLSYQQERLWFLDRLDGQAGAAYHIEGAFRLSGKLNSKALQQALQAVVARHESLRTVFVADEDDRPRQIIPPSAEAAGIKLTEDDASELDEAALHALVGALLAEPFDLGVGPLFRARLLTIAEDDHVLVVGGHHTVLDGWSVGLLLKEVSALYRETVTGEPAALPELTIQYADYAAWQRQVLCGKRLAEEIAWWRDRLSGMPEAIALPFDRPRPKRLDYRGGSVPVHVPADVTAGLKALARSEGATLFMALQAAFSALLSRLGAGEDVVIGTAVARRPRFELEALAGFFVNTVALRSQVDGLASFRAHLQTTKDVVLGAFEHQQVPFEAVVEALSPARAMGHAPLVQVMLVLQNTPDADAALTLPGVAVALFDQSAETAQFELSLDLTETAEGLAGTLSFASQVFDRETVERLGAMFVRLLGAVAAAPEALVADLPLMDEAERHQVVALFNDTAVEYPQHETVVDLFCAQAAERPDAVAVVDGERTLSYGALDAASNQLARHLIGLGVGPEVVVGVCLERSAELIIALVAVWKAGGAYLPLDPDYPEARLHFILADAGAKLVLATSNTEAALQDDGAAAHSDGLATPRSHAQVHGDQQAPTRLVLLDHPATAEGGAGLSDAPVHHTERTAPLTPQRLAYVIYTSGSTGNPKGVMVGHGGLSARLSWMQSDTPLEPHDVILQKTPATFDVSVWEFFWWMCVGARVVMLAPHKHRDPRAVANTMAACGVTTVHFVPSMFSAFLQHVATRPERLLGNTHLKQVFTSGEVLTASQVDAFKSLATDAITLVNLYGPTEATVDATTCVPSGKEPVIPIGTPVANSQVYVVDARLAPVPVGVSGELLIGGVQVSRGYLGRPGLTAEKFIADPFSGEAGARLYRTGDLARWRPDGTLEFLGRMDAQVKIRGMRVELGEIEAVLTRLSTVDQAVVAPFRTDDGDTQLVAYVVPAAASTSVRSSAIVDDWGQVFTQFYAALEDDPDDIDFATWVSSYTGDSYPREVMLEWRQETLKKLVQLPHRRVLEVGCGAGSILTGLAPHAERYVGTDVSGSAIAMSEWRSAAREDLRHVELHTAAADESTTVVDGTFDLIILNSVAQYFPNLQYLHTVLTDLSERLATNGCLFVGDVRDLRTLEHFHADVALTKQTPPDRVSVLRMVSHEKELVVHPAWFQEFARNQPSIGSVSLSPRAEKHITEMSAFRYDALLRRRDGEQRTIPVEWIDASRSGSGVLEDALRDRPNAAIGVQLARDDRLAAAMASHSQVFEGSARSVLRERANRELLDLSSLSALAADSGRSLSARLSAEPGTVTAIYLPIGETDDRHLPQQAVLPLPARLSNDPSLIVTVAPETISSIRAELSKALPEHMVPSGFVALSRVPLTASGKVDRNALPEADIAVASTAYAAPRSEREALMCTIMRDVIAHDRLSLERVGIDDQFFDIGGHSIFAAQFAMRLEKALGEPVPVRLIFEAPTVRALSARLHERFEANRPTVQRADRTQSIPASFEQERMWLANRIHGERGVYNEGLPLVLRGQVNTQALVTAMQGVLDRYEVLRTRLVWQDDRLIQQIDPEGSLKVSVEDWSDRSGSTGALEDEAQERTRTLLSMPYDLATEHPCRALIIKLSDETHVWVLATHHAVGDNWSLSHVMPAVFLALYDAALAGRSADLPSIPLHYADYAAWQHSAAMAPVLEEQLNYWRTTLAGAPEVLDLPSDRPRPAVREHRGDRLFGKGFSAETWRAVERFAVAHDGTPFMVFVAGLSALLSRVSGTNDIVIGTPHVMKPDEGLWEEFGYFGNTLALRIEVDPLQSFEDHFATVRQTVLSAFAHQDVPFEAVVKELGVLPANATPVFQVMLVMHAFLDKGAFVRDDFAIEALGGRPPVAKTDLTVDINPGADGVGISLEYATDIFDQETAERLSAMFVRLLGTAVLAPETLLADLPLMDAAERHQVVALFNDTAVDTPQDRTVVDLFCAQATERPDAVAVVDGTRTLTYAALDAASNRLARHLMSLGVGPEVVVGVCLERSAELIVSVLAIWKAGGAYLPLDPNYPEARLRFMLHDAGAGMMLTTSDIATALQADNPDASSHAHAHGEPHPPARLILLDDTATRTAVADLSHGPLTDADRSAPLKPHNLAYVIYTSGSTGLPKGVMVGHGESVALGASLQAKYGLAPNMQVLQVASPAFTQIIEEIAPTLMLGSCVILVRPESGILSADDIEKLSRHPGPLIAMLVPSVLESVTTKQIEHIKILIVTGERVSETLVARLSRDRRLFNEYGSSETTICATVAELDVSVAPSIGTPVANTQVYIVDDRLGPVPVGVSGELLVGGAQVSRGYLGRAGLTSEKFIADPFSGEAGARLYRTGDLARWRTDGTLEFLGRMDAQVKIRGMRVELGEIEAALASCEGVAQAVVTAPKNETGDTRLVAYLVPTALSDADLAGALDVSADALTEAHRDKAQIVPLDGRVDLEAIRAGLTRTLPEHMVPSGYVGLSRLPLTASGKVDRKALPETEAAVARAAYEAPDGPIEAAVAKAMATLVGMDRVGRQDNFFALGGHSLMAVRLVALLEEKTGKTLPLKTVFEAATLAEIAAALGTSGIEAPPTIHWCALLLAPPPHLRCRS